MINKFMITPFFLDRLTPAYASLRQPGWRVNHPTLPHNSPQERMAALYGPLADFVEQVAKSGERPLSLSGDCCSSIGVLAGLQHAGIDPTLIWFDAHGDFNTWRTTPSGFLGGMPLAMIVGRGEQTIVDGVELQPLSETQVILTDGRDLDPGEGVILADSQVTHLKNVEELLEGPLPEGPLYVHFDTDVVNPSDAPAMNYPVPEGPSAETMQTVFKHLADSGQVVAASLSAWNPALDVKGRSQRICMNLFSELIKS